MPYPKFSVPGVPDEEVWQLFNTSNYQYYKDKIALLSQSPPVCPFCVIDPKKNKVRWQNDFWRGWVNTMAPSSGQFAQTIFPLRRHIQYLTEVTDEEMANLLPLVRQAEEDLGLKDGVYNVRFGDPAKNAKSVPHLHFNGLYPTGEQKIEITISKSQVDLEKKLPILEGWEMYRQLELAGHPDIAETLPPQVWNLIKDRMKPPENKIS